MHREYISTRYPQPEDLEVLLAVQGHWVDTDPFESSELVLLLSQQPQLGLDGVDSIGVS